MRQLAALLCVCMCGNLPHAEEQHSCAIAVTTPRNVWTRAPYIARRCYLHCNQHATALFLAAGASRWMKGRPTCRVDSHSIFAWSRNRGRFQKTPRWRRHRNCYQRGRGNAAMSHLLVLLTPRRNCTHKWRASIACCWAMRCSIIRAARLKQNL